jgi:uncharacterized membrane protein (UPF0127 family)
MRLPAPCFPRRAGLLFCVALIFWGAAGCVSGDAKPQARLETLELSVAREDGIAVPVLAEIARTAEQRERGLMGRKTLADGEGMLFVFELDRILAFWMKNTRIPLSIAYIAYDGRILEIHDMEPFNLSPVQSSRSARYALEVPQGWFSRVGVKPGDILGPTLPQNS